MENFLYDVIAYNYALGKKTIKFEKIKNLLRDTNQSIQLSAFYELLRKGVIDKADVNSYSLSASKIFSYLKGKFSLGVNLPESFLMDYRDHILFQNLGLTIFKDLNCIDTPYIITFNLDHYTLQFQSLKKIAKEWSPIDLQYCKSYIKLHKFDTLKNDWREVKVYGEDNALYKRFIHNDLYFEYVFFYNNKYYSIKSSETEKILFIRLALIKQKIFSFDTNTQMLSVKNGILLPNFLYKTLFITHVLNNGEFPTYDQFNLNKKQVNQILKPLKISYTLI